ncbi:MAG: BPSS1780 family membrane protein [Candidatus Dactylopiibacterium sp.]|nr:BPSS1780 family membrane protein [Candidatus Dactylopiibacterium sp.]
MSSRPNPPAHHGLAHLPRPRSVSTFRCLSWLAAGWRLFAARPAEWILMALGTFVLLALSTLLVPLPLVGPLVPPLLLALLMGGMLHAARLQRASQPGGVELLFSGARLHPGNLTLVGLFFAAPLILVHLLVYLALSGGVLVSVFGISLGTTLNAAVAGLLGMLADLGIALAVFLLLWGLMMLSLLLAPALIMFNDIASFDAMRLSLSASLRNLATMFVLAVLLYVLFGLALLPAGLGILIYVPVVVGTIAAAHADLFEAEAVAALPAAGEGV